MLKILVKKNKPFGWKHFLSINFVSLVYTLFRQTFVMTSGASVRDIVDLILVRKNFNCFNFYSIDRLVSWNVSRMHGQLRIYTALLNFPKKLLLPCKLKLERTLYSQFPMVHEFGAIWKALLEMRIHQEASMLEVVDNRFFSPKFLDIFYFVEITGIDEL